MSLFERSGAGPLSLRLFLLAMALHLSGCGSNHAAGPSDAGARDGTGGNEASLDTPAAEANDGNADVSKVDASDASPADASVDALSGDAQDASSDVREADAGRDAPDAVDAISGDRQGTDAGMGTDATDGRADAGPADAATDGRADGGPADAGGPVTDGSGSDVGDGSTDLGACAPAVGPVFLCGGLVSCNGATSYCRGSNQPSTCEPLPAECLCAQTHTCACLIAHALIPCDGGGLTCTPYADGGQLSAFLGCP